MRANSFKPIDKDLNASSSSFDEGVFDLGHKNEGKVRHLSTLTFTYKFEHANDTVFFSHFAPYTMDDLEDYLYKQKKHYGKTHLDSILRTDLLSKSFANNPCYLLTISENMKTYIPSKE
jgi:hypothetical protein